MNTIINNAKKYKLEYSEIGYTTLYRIVALKDFGNVHKGDIGGYVQSEKNLSHDGDCWIHNDAIVKGDAKISGNAQIYGESKESCYGGCFGNNYPWYYRTVIEGRVHVYENAIVSNSHVHGGDIEIYGNAIIDKSQVSDCAKLYGNCSIYDSMICDFCKIYDNATIINSYIGKHYIVCNNEYLNDVSMN